MAWPMLCIGGPPASSWKYHRSKLTHRVRLCGLAISLIENRDFGREFVGAREAAIFLNNLSLFRRRTIPRS